MEIQNYPNYLIYRDGTIERIKGQKQGIRKASPNEDGYLRLGLRNEKGEKKFRVHRLVAIHYIENPNDYPEVDHIDRNILNNHYTNLRWANRSMQNLNKKIYKNNKSGFKNISYDKHGNRWRFIDLKRNVRKQSMNKIDMICYKYIHNLRIKAKHF
jgi:hypothetical protein